MQPISLLALSPLALAPLALLWTAAGPQDSPGLQAAAQSASIVNTRHNLSTSGPGPYKAQFESRICIFCHTPHRARSVAPLWNREDSTETYMQYQSSTFQGSSTQPSGDSKLCLSCHDGSIALGAVLSEAAGIEMSPGHTHLDTGSAALGTNLADDHPISFDYATSAGGSGSEYLPPGSITPPVHLDMAGSLQCTSCHDPHDNSWGDFLRASDQYSALCRSCHVPNGWSQSSHSLSNATWTGAGSDPWPHAKYPTVAENGCTNCHMTHGAPAGERLLRASQEEQTCLPCHSGQVAVKDLAAELLKPFRHSPVQTQGVHDPTENPLLMPRHAECQDCHDAHQSRPGGAAAPGVPGPLTGASGVDTNGQPVATIQAGYELCYKCHADNHGSSALVPRFYQQLNTRLEFDPGNASYHPIEAPGKSSFVPSLKAGWTTASMMTCQDCHQSEDSPTFGGTGPAGPHGSTFKPLLGAYLNTNDGVNESAAQYALCYRCHSRDSIRSDQSFEKHKKHIDEDVACTGCHDPHGVSSTQAGAMDGTHLINFDMRIVTPNSKGDLFFRDTGFQRGECSLSCHGEDHDQEDYKQ